MIQVARNILLNNRHASIKDFMLLFPESSEKLLVRFWNGAAAEVDVFRLLEERIKFNDLRLRWASEEEEKLQIDLWIDDVAIQIKPFGANKNRVRAISTDNYDFIMIYYKYLKSGKIKIYPAFFKFDDNDHKQDYYYELF